MNCKTSSKGSYDDSADFVFFLFLLNKGSICLLVYQSGDYFCLLSLNPIIYHIDLCIRKR